MVPKSGVGRAWEGSKWSMKRGLGASWFPSVGWVWEGQKWSMKTGGGCFMAHKSGVGRAWEGSNWFPRVLWEWFGKAKNSQDWGGKGLGRLKMKHEKGFGCFMVPKSGVGRMEASAVGDSAGRRKRSLRHLTRPLLEFTTWTLAFVHPFSGFSNKMRAIEPKFLKSNGGHRPQPILLTFLDWLSGPRWYMSTCARMPQTT